MVPNGQIYKPKDRIPTEHEIKIKQKLLLLPYRLEWFSSIARMNDLGYFMELCEATASLETENLIEL